MALEFRLDTKLSQNLVMTPRLQQAIKLLQYNHMELVEHIEQELLENPTLEKVADSEGGMEDGRIQLEGDLAKLERESAEQSNGASENVDWERFLESMSDRPSSGPVGGTIYDDLPPIETNLTYTESLADHLLFQLSVMRMNDEERDAAETVIYNLDSRGYLAVPVEDLAESLGLPVEDVEFARQMVLELDPVGCGALDLSECLVAQAKVLHPEDPTFIDLFERHLGNLERRNYPAIARDLGLHLDDVVEYHKMIQDFEPHPGRAYTTEEPRYITPDLYVVNRGGRWVVALNEDGVPDLKVSGYYKKVLQSSRKEDRDYIEDKLKGAEFLIKSINRRRQTIRLVMESILRLQHDFFEVGAEGLRPLVLQDVADDVKVTRIVRGQDGEPDTTEERNIHMSTVSRVTSNKYVHTPHGIFELKYFFSAGVRQSDGADMAAEAIKQRLKALIAEENPKKPLSDQKIANLLKDDGIDVARRTVAKYREALGILSSSKRKKMF